jgi:hypothetical protein
MAYQDYHTNIMLDLECCDALVPDPAIIELAAIHFDLDTGETLGSFTTPINYQSCIDHGLKTSKDGLAWVNANIRSTLTKSEESSIVLSHALFKFSKFLRDSIQRNAEKRMASGLSSDRSQLMIWGNGAVADNVWIASAYRACDMERPWKFYNDMCVRTFVKQCAYMTGKDFARNEAFKGKKHVALDDCLHQVSYLVKARNHLMPAQTPRKKRTMLPTPETSFCFPDDDAETQDEKDAEQVLTGPVQRGTGLMSPETSFSEPKDTQDKREGPPISSLTKSQPRKRIGLMTPATLFSAPQPEEDELEATQPNESLETPSPRRVGLLSPEGSSSAVEDGNRIDQVRAQTQDINSFSTVEDEDNTVRVRAQTKIAGVASGAVTMAATPPPAEPVTPEPRRQFFQR